MALDTSMRTYLSYTNIFIVLQSIALLEVFSNLKIGNHIVQKAIKTISESTLAVYLIHENPNIRNKFIKGVSKELATLTTGKMLLNYYKLCFMIFFAGIIIDLFRRLLFHFVKIDTAIKKVSQKVEYKK